MKTDCNKPLGLVFFPAFDWAISPTHPEREERLLFTRDQVLEEGLLDLPQIREYKPQLASMTDLERVHIVSQPFLGPHLASHGAMLGFAIRRRDWNEVLGQMVRIILAPLGSLTGRLPVGNTGRSNVSAFAPMPIPADLAEA